MFPQRIIYFLILLLLIGLNSYAEIPIQELEFHNKPLSDVLMALGAIGGYSILSDDTITSTVTHRFTDTTFEEALELLSKKYGFYYEETESKVLSISKIYTIFNEEKDQLTVKAKDVEIFHILQATSGAIGKTILFDPLPGEKLSLNSIDISPEKFLTMLLSRFPDYSLVNDTDYYYIKRNTAQNTTERNSASNTIIMHSEDSFSLNIERGELLATLDELFTKANKEYVLLFKSSSVLRDLNYTQKSFHELLKLILVQTGGDYTISNDIYYIFDINRQDILKQYKSAEYLQLKYLSAEDIPTLLPNVLSSSTFYKINKDRNGLILSGSIEEIRPLKEYIATIDKPLVGRQYYTFYLDYIKSSEAVESFPPRLKYPAPFLMKESNAFLSLYTKEQKLEVDSLLNAIDIPMETHVLTLHYLKAEDFLKKIPPPFTSEDFMATGAVSSIYFKGSREKLNYLKDIISTLDIPQPQIRYKLLIIQYQESQGFNFEFSASNSLSQDDSESAYLGSIGNLLSLNFDILSTFGQLFALKLNTSITNNAANVLADTTLHGLSGESIKFQNSSTYRYQEYEVDEDGNLTSSGVTREISTGIFLDITGWISGDNMITMEINSTLSKEGTSSSSSTSNLPPTSERVINTHIRTPSGKPIVIGGLKQNELSTQIEKVPFFGDIPLIGFLFRKTSTTEENTELVIYIVPYLDMGESENIEPEEEINRLFDRFFT